MLFSIGRPEELDDLLGRIVKLAEFVESVDYKDMDEEEKECVIEQLRAMTKYASMLHRGQMMHKIKLESFGDSDMCVPELKGKVRVIES